MSHMFGAIFDFDEKWFIWQALINQKYSSYGFDFMGNIWPIMRAEIELMKMKKVEFPRYFQSMGMDNGIVQFRRKSKH